MIQSYTGRAKFQSDEPFPLGALLVAVRCRVGDDREKDIALLDTASPWCILPPAIAVEMGFDVDGANSIAMYTRFGLLHGELLRLPITFLADDGEAAEIDATWFLSPGWPGPLVIGWKGCLERFPFAFDPRADDFYFAEY